MNTVYNSVIGCDVHRDTIVCCALQNSGEYWCQSLKTFPTTVSSLIEMSEWCKQFTPDYVLLESTGVYWMSPYKYLERAGLRVAIINPHHIKRMAGKKTDTEDAKWLAELGTVGSFTPSYILSEKWRNVRAASRYLTRLIQIYNTLKNREIKIFLECGFRLNVFSDPFGKNGTLARDALLEGKLSEEIVKMLDLDRLKAPASEIIEALTGDLSEWHKITILANRNVMQAIAKEIVSLKEKLINRVKELDEDFFLRVQTLPGVSAFQAAQIIIENGGQEIVEYFKNSGQYSSWLGVCPGNKESGGKRFSGKCRKGNVWLRRHLTEAAQAAVRCNGSTIQSKYRTKRVTLGTKKAIFAAAHYLARMFFLIAKNKQPYFDPSIDYEKIAFEDNLKRYVSKARRYVEWKVEAENSETGEVLSSKVAAKKCATASVSENAQIVPVTKTAKAAPAAKKAKAASAPAAKKAKAASAPAAKTAKAAPAPAAKKAKATPAPAAKTAKASSKQAAKSVADQPSLTLEINPTSTTQQRSVRMLNLMITVVIMVVFGVSAVSLDAKAHSHAVYSSTKTGIQSVGSTTKYSAQASAQACAATKGSDEIPATAAALTQSVPKDRIRGAPQATIV